MLELQHNAPLDSAAIARLSEFFDNDPCAMYAFLCDVWLPHVRSTFASMQGAAFAGDARRTRFYCESLRDAALTAGAHHVAFETDSLDLAILADRWSDALRYLLSLADLLKSVEAAIHSRR